MWHKAVVFIVGFALTVLGITVVLQQWDNIVVMFKAVIGPLVAVIGLVMMFAASLK